MRINPEIHIYDEEWCLFPFPTIFASGSYNEVCITLAWLCFAIYITFGSNDDV